MSKYFVNSRELAEGADIRIVSFNVLFNNTLKEPTPAERSVALKELLEHFQPDVIGLQEMNEPWHEVFATFKGDYEIFDPTNGAGRTNNSCIAYNTKKVKLLDHGVQIFSKGDRPHLRLANWGYFEHIATGKRVLGINTHWDIVKEYIMIQAEEMGNLANELVAKYNCPIISTGDYNRLESTDEYKRYVEIANLHNSKYTAKEKGRVHYTCHGFSPLGKMPKLDVVECIDHVLGSSDVEFLYYTVIADQIVLDNSDHCPVYADMKLN